MNRQLARGDAPSDEGGYLLGEKIRRYVLSKIDSGEWPQGYRIPSEPRLAEEFESSRMTIHMALRDLAAEGFLIRRRGAGTYVAQPRNQSTFLELKNIHDEIETRGNHHTAEILLAETIDSDLISATELNVQPGSTIFHTILVHKENNRPLQVEDRYVNPQFCSDYLQQDFTRITPHKHLMAAGPLEEVEHIIQAIPADDTRRKLLEMQEGEPLLLLRRRTWSRRMIATSVRLFHPGSRFSLVGHMTVGRGV